MGRRRLLDAFRIFDKDGDGAVSMPEMARGLRSLGRGQPRARLCHSLREKQVGSSGGSPGPPEHLG